MSVSVNRRRSISISIAMVAAFFIAAQPVAASSGFGSKLSGGPWFPSNAYPGSYCDHVMTGGSGTFSCTWILLQPFNGGTSTAPSNGSINRVKIINGQGFSFKLVIARKNASGQFKVINRSDKITYATDPCDPDCVVHTKTVTPALAVATGDYVGIQTARTSTLRCDQGGDHIALFSPPLAPGGGYTTPTGTDGCWLLIRAVYK